MAIISIKPVGKPYDFSIGSESVKIGVGDSLPRLPLYDAKLTDEITINVNVIDDNNTTQTQLDQVDLGMPSLLVLPFTKYSGGINGVVLDEHYFITTLTKGVFSVNGKFPTMGNWIMKEDRVNQSLQAVGANLKLKTGNVSFIVT